MGDSYNQTYSHLGSNRTSPNHAACPPAWPISQNTAYHSAPQKTAPSSNLVRYETNHHLFSSSGSNLSNFRAPNAIETVEPWKLQASLTSHSNDTGYGSFGACTSSTQPTTGDVSPHYPGSINPYTYEDFDLAANLLMTAGTSNFEDPPKPQSQFQSFPTVRQGDHANRASQHETPSRKRTQNDRAVGTVDTFDQLQPAQKVPKLADDDLFGSSSSLQSPYSGDRNVSSKNELFPHGFQAAPYPSGYMESLPNQNPLKPELVSKKQSKFIRKWYRDFVENQQFPLGDDEFLTADKISALAILIKLQPRTVHDWITKNLMGTNATVTSTEDHRYTWTSQRRAEETTALGLHPPQAQVTDDIQPLPDEILELIQNHERARNRVRTTSDGRRRVNRGKYECTFRCGYRTKNVFDWKRHEENHQPQNFWLCTVCRQSDQPIDFLVHRSDKLLKHAQEKHKGRDPKDILNTSKLDYIAGFKSPCGFCGHPFSSWEDRNKHILDHFDGQIGGETFDMTRWLDPWPQYEKDPEDECDEDSDSSSESSGSSGDDGPDKRDATGGSGGGSGVQGGGEASYKWFDALRGGRAANKGRGNYRGRGTMTRKCVLSMRGPPSDTPPEAMDDEVIRVSQSSHKPETCATSPLVRKAPRKGYSQKTVTIWPSNNSLPREDEHLQLHPTLRRQTLQRAPVQRSLPLPFLGRGAHGFVDVVQQYITGKVYARKRCGKSSFHQEVEIMKRMSHPHIVRFVAAYEQNSSLSLVMSPVAQSTLKHYLDIPNGQSRNQSRIHKWTGCLSSALSYIHGSRIRHADIKPQNILLREEDVYISDFGISRVVSEPDSDSESISPMTPLYAALEIAERHLHGRKADVFSLGCVFVEMLTVAQGHSVTELHRYLGFSASQWRLGGPPAYYKRQDLLFNWISKLRQRASRPAQYLWDICGSMLQDIPARRPSASLLVSMLRQMLEAEADDCVHECMVAPITQNQSISQQPKRITVETNNYIDHTSEDYVLSPSTTRLLRYKDHSVYQSVRASAAESPPEPNISALNPWRFSHIHNTIPTPLNAQSNRISDMSDSRQFIVKPSPEARFEKHVASSEPGTSPIQVSFIHVFALNYAPNGTGSTNVVIILNCVPASFVGGQEIGRVEIGRPDASSRTRADIKSPSGEAIAYPPKTESSLSSTTSSRTWRRDFSSGPVDIESRRVCHKCERLFTAPWLIVCRRCLHYLCEKCPRAPDKLLKREWPLKAEFDLAAIGSHLSPPAYSLHDTKRKPSRLISMLPSDYQPVDEEKIVFDLIIQQNQTIGEDPRDRFLQESPSTFDLKQLPLRNCRDEWWVPDPSPAASLHVGPPQLRSEGSPSIEGPDRKRPRLGPGPQSEPKEEISHSNSNSRQGNPRRVKQTTRLKKEKPKIKREPPASEGRKFFSKLPYLQRSISPSRGADPGTPTQLHLRKVNSTSSAAIHAVSRLPRITKSHSSSSSNRSHAINRLPLIKTHSITPPSHDTNLMTVTSPTDTRPRSSPSPELRRSSDSIKSTGSKEFRWQGRHANQWLLNDISFRKGARKIGFWFWAGGRGDREGGGGGGVG